LFLIFIDDEQGFSESKKNKSLFLRHHRNKKK